LRAGFAELSVELIASDKAARGGSRPRPSRHLWTASAWGLLALIVGLWGILHFVGERSWLVMPLLYLPHGLLVLPLAVLTAGLLTQRSWRLLGTQVLAAAVLAGPLLGVQLNSPAQASGQPSIRIFSYNVYFGLLGHSNVAARIPADVDVILLQAVGNSGAVLQSPRFAKWSLRFSGQFAIASRFPIIETATPAEMPGRPGPAFERYRLETPLGRIDLYNVHTSSPRRGFLPHRRLRGLFAAIESGTLRRNIEQNIALREDQVRALAQDAARSPFPVIIAGDTNLPGLSRTFRDHLGNFQDGFVEAGSGLGYTFPGHELLPWMRIDRVLASRHLRFIDFKVGQGGGSDHKSVTARIASAPNLALTRNRAPSP
jgi:endonuclease/exonuclease/phosphatase (EEP) superfamily protein YafD